MSDIVEAINGSWGWTGITAVEVHATSPMGHILLSDDAGAFHYLDTDGMELIRLGSHEEAEAHFALDETKEVWLATALIDGARALLGDAPEGSVFTLKPHAMLQGQYAVEEMWHCSLTELIRFSGDAARQLEGLPLGSAYRIEVTD